MRLLQTTGKKQTDASGVSPLAHTFPSNLTPGSTVVLTTTHYQGSALRITAITASGTSGNRDVEKSDVPSLNHTEIWRFSDINGASNAISITVNSGSYLIFSAEEWRGFLVGTPLDQTGTGGETTSAAPSATAAGNTSQDYELAYAAFTDYVGSNWISLSGPIGGVQTFVEVDGTASEAGGGGYVPLSTISTPTLSFTTGASMGWISALATYKVYGPAHHLAYDFVGSGGSSITTGVMVTNVSPGLMLTIVARGINSDHASNSVTDSKSNIYVLETVNGSTSKVYGSEWPTSGTAIYSCANPTGGSSHTVTVAKPTSSDEVTILPVELPPGFDTIVDAQWNYVNNGVRAPSVTTTDAAWLIHFWGGADSNGELNPNPETGWFKLEWTSSLASNHVQIAAFAKYVSSAGTYDGLVTPGTSQKSQNYIIAIQASGASPSNYAPSADVQVAGWTPTPDGFIFATIDEDTTPVDTDYVTSPLLRSVAEKCIETLDNPMVAGNYTVNIRVKTTSSTGNLRVRFLDSGGSDVGVTSIQGITTTLTTYALSVTLTDTATQVQIEVTT